LHDVLKEGDTFWDIGANEGIYSILASRLVGGSGTVICVEPQGRMQAVLFRNIAENNAYNVHVFQKAIAASVGMATLWLTPDMNTGGSGLIRTTSYRTPTELVPQTTLSELQKLLSLKAIKLMKIDIEGFEYEAILGSRDLFEGDAVEHIALELHPGLLKARRKSESEILDFLTANGYRRNPRFRNCVMTKSAAPAR
jgi:FkbM family methyltransferase